jgi:hypothetical protein
MSSTPPAPDPNPTPAAKPTSTPATGPVGGKVFLGVATALFVGWMSWLSYTALTKSQAPTVSHAQAAAASIPVKAELFAGVAEKESFHRRLSPLGGEITTVLKAQADKPAFVVTVKEQLTPNGPTKGSQIAVSNLPACSGYTGEGEYLLLLNRDDEATIDGKPSYTIVGQQRSPGADLEGVGPPRIYRWSDDVGKQVQRLYP